MLREHARHAGRVLDALANDLIAGAVKELVGREHLAFEPELGPNLLGDGLVVASDHLYVDAHLAGSRKGLCSIIAWRIEERHKAENAPLSVASSGRDG